MVQDRKNIIKTLWVCPQCAKHVGIRPRLKRCKETGIKHYAGEFLACPNAYIKDATCDYSLSPEGLNKFQEGHGTLRSCGSGNVFRTMVLGEKTKK